MWQKFLGNIIAIVLEKTLRPFLTWVFTSIAKLIQKAVDEIEYRKEKKERERKIDEYKNSNSKDSARDSFDNMP